jgi:NADH-quinone oxidoreductase subunit L
VVLIIGASGALWLGLIGIVQNDIKRVIAYSTMSQLGYMIAATGASAYTAGMFHLMTHAFFKALLFLGAGSVIVALHHEQNIHKMGNLKRYMPLTYLTFLIGSLSLTAIPPFSGFFSKDAIIEAVHHAPIFGAHYAYLCLLVGAFVTALYTFRLLFIVFHGKENLAHPEKIKESCWKIVLPFMVLAIPSTIIGLAFAKSMLYSHTPLLGTAIYTNPAHQAFAAELAAEYHGWFAACLAAFKSLPFWFAIAGIATAWVSYIRYPAIPGKVSHYLAIPYQILVHRYGINQLYHLVFVRGARRLSGFLYRFADMMVIDTWLVNGSAQSVARLSSCVRRLQSGYLYHYAFAMIIGVVGLLGWVVWVR